MAQNLNTHLEEETLERYAMNAMAEEESAQVEEHLLVCDGCRERLDQTEAFIQTMKAARRPALIAESGWKTWFRLPPRLVWAGAACIAVIAALLLVRSTSGPHSDQPVAVMLEAARGDSAVRQAPSGTALVLRPNIAGLPSFDPYVVQLVSASGGTVWEGNFRPGTGALVAAQKAGTYFVRLYSPSRELLREYTLQVAP